MTTSPLRRADEVAFTTIAGLFIGLVMAYGIVIIESVAGRQAIEEFYGVSLYRFMFAFAALGCASGLAAGVLGKLLASISGALFVGLVGAAWGTLVFEVAMLGCSPDARFMCDIIGPVAGCLISIQVAPSSQSEY